jgi:centriolin
MASSALSPVHSNHLILQLSPELISSLSGCPLSELHQLRALDLHIRGNKKGKIKKIESLLVVPNLLQLNLSYNLITKIEGLDRLIDLVELNLAENSISKIEGIDHLRCLERLNLSGNQIKRIPENISNLANMVHLRIARNKLENLNDVRYLSKLTKLKNLRLDDNPICEQESSHLFVIYHVKSLVSYNGVEISNKERNEARRKFAFDEVSDLR